MYCISHALCCLVSPKKSLFSTHTHTHTHTNLIKVWRKQIAFSVQPCLLPRGLINQASRPQNFPPDEISHNPPALYLPVPVLLQAFNSERLTTPIERCCERLNLDRVMRSAIGNRRRGHSCRQLTVRKI